MKKLLLALALIAGGINQPAYANPFPYPLAGKWEVTATAGDLQTLNYEPRQNLLWEFELLPSGAYAFIVYAYGHDGRPFITASVDIEPGTPPPPNMRLRTSRTDNLGTVTLIDYDLYFDFVSKMVRGRYAKRLYFMGNSFPLQLFGLVSGRRITPEQTSLPKPLPKAPGFYEEEAEREMKFDKCHQCIEARKRACAKANNANLAAAERKRLKTICNQDCDCDDGCQP